MESSCYVWFYERKGHYSLVNNYNYNFNYNIDNTNNGKIFSLLDAVLSSYTKNFIELAKSRVRAMTNLVYYCIEEYFLQDLILMSLKFDIIIFV